MRGFVFRSTEPVELWEDIKTNHGERFTLLSEDVFKVEKCTSESFNRHE